MKTYYFIGCASGELMWWTESFNMSEAVSYFQRKFPKVQWDEVFVTDSSGF